MMEPCNIGNLGVMGRSLNHVDGERDPPTGVRMFVMKKIKHGDS
jgi:hypothetical protein